MSIRDEYVQGLRDLATWLEANPAAPIERFDTAHVQHYVDKHEPDRAAACRELDAAADALGMEAGPLFGSDSSHYGFRCDFGPVHYTAISIERTEDES